MAAVRFVLGATFLLLAGCVGSPGEGLGGDSDLPAALPKFALPVPVSRSMPGAEPVVAVASDGTIFVEGIGTTPLPGGAARTNVNKVWRSTDDGAAWQDVTPPGFGQERSNDGFVAVGNDDRVYAANVFSLTFQVYRSDDKGTTWTRLAVPPIPLLMHRHWIVPVGPTTVHVAVEALPPEFATYLAGQAPPMPPLGSPNQGLWYLRSDDRGNTWTMPVQIDPNVNFAGQGNLVVDEAGTHLYVVRYEEPGRHAYEQTYETGLWYLIASHDGGHTWKRQAMFPLTSELAAALPSTALDENGTLYTVWSQALSGDSRLHYSYSRDEGRTWIPPRPLGIGGGTQAMPWIAARGPGALGILWYQADVAGTASKVDAAWFVDYTLVTKADTDAPAGAPVRVTPEAVHQGNVCAKGPACRAPEDRRLLDYPWIAFGPDTRAHLVFASTKWTLPSAFAVHAVETVPTPFEV